MNEKITNLSSYISIPNHKHRITMIRRYFNGWRCDICKINGDKDIPFIIALYVILMFVLIVLKNLLKKEKLNN